MGDIMKKLIKLVFIFVFVFVLTACGIEFPPLEEDAIGFRISYLEDENDDNMGYSTIEYNGRTYATFGLYNNSLKEGDIDKCIGYIVQDENASSIVDLDNKDTRVYTLKSDPENNFLMEYYIKSNLMNEPIFYRAIDTRGKDIKIPSFIKDIGESYWNK